MKDTTKTPVISVMTSTKKMEEGRIEKISVVGISNSGWRYEEYTPTFDQKEDSGGYAEIYLEFLIEEVKAHIDSNYRIKPFREHTAISGSSIEDLCLFILL